MNPLSLFVAAAVAALPTALYAEWTGAPAVPTPLVTGASEQVQPKLVPAPGGGFYLSWLDNREGGYDPYVQRFDAFGAAQWPEPGIKVADTSFSSTEDYGLTVDGAGNAVIVFRDDRFGGVKITAQAISPAGMPLWGANGVQMPTGAGSVNSPKATAGTDGAVYAGWSENGRANILRLNGDGSSAWGAPYAVTDGTTAFYTLADLQPGDAGSVILSCVRYVNLITTPKVLHTQKLSPDGVPQWAPPTVPVFTTGSLQIANFPTFLPDGEGGAIFSFYTTGPLQCFVQWVDSNGTLKFGTNGTSVTPTSTGMERTNPDVAFDASTGTVYANWIEHVPNSSNFGVAVQAFDSTGARLWGSGGAVTTYVQPIGTVYDHQQARAVVLDGKPVFLWVHADAFGVQAVKAHGMNPNGTTAWATISVADQPGSKSRLAVMPLAGSHNAAVIWQGSTTDGDDLFGQSLGSNGTLWSPFGAGNPMDLNGDGVVNGADLGLLLAAWGDCPGCSADLNGDGVVNGADLGLLLAAWGA